MTSKIQHNTIQEVYPQNQASNEKRAYQIQKVTFAALIAIGILGIAAAGVGLVAFGGHQGWWAVGSLSHLSQLEAMIMMAAGGGGGILLILPCAIGAIKNRAPFIPQINGGRTTLDTSYTRTNDNEIDDLVYMDMQHGFACIVDGTGHGNPEMQKALKEHFDPFIQQYQSGMQNIKSPEELASYFTKQVRTLEKAFQNKDLPLNKRKVCPKDCTAYTEADTGVGTFLDGTYKPAMSFTQLIQNGDQTYLLVAQAADTMVVIEEPNGEITTTLPATHYGLGDTTIASSIQSYNITGAKRVIGFSDGIGEFMTFDELKTEINKSKSSTLFQNLKNQAMVSRTVDKTAKAANGCYLKAFDPNDSGHYDDMSLFVFDL